MSKLTMLAAAGAGYVLGARAGRERYDQLTQTFNKVKNDPRVQEKAQQATDVVKEKAPVVADTAKAKASSAAGAAKDKVGGSDAKSEAAGDSLNPDRLKLTDETGPQGTLP
jgi:hypothetical protein